MFTSCLELSTNSRCEFNNNLFKFSAAFIFALSFLPQTIYTGQTIFLFYLYSQDFA